MTVSPSQWDFEGMVCGNMMRPTKYLGQTSQRYKENSKKVTSQDQYGICLNTKGLGGMTQV